MKKDDDNFLTLLVYRHTASREEGDALAHKICDRFGGAGIRVGKKKEPNIYKHLIAFVSRVAGAEVAKKMDKDMKKYHMSIYIPSRHIAREPGDE